MSFIHVSHAFLLSHSTFLFSGAYTQFCLSLVTHTHVCYGLWQRLRRSKWILLNISWYYYVYIIVVSLLHNPTWVIAFSSLGAPGTESIGEASGLWRWILEKHSLERFTAELLFIFANLAQSSSLFNFHRFLVCIFCFRTETRTCYQHQPKTNADITALDYLYIQLYTRIHVVVFVRCVYDENTCEAKVALNMMCQSGSCLYGCHHFGLAVV